MDNIEEGKIIKAEDINHGFYKKTQNINTATTISYGTSLPTTGNEGDIFLKIEEE